MKQLIFSFLLFLISQVVLCQVELSGLVRDSLGPISYANVVLTDSTNAVKAYDISDGKGNFMIDIERGSYTLEVSILGYQDWRQDINLEDNFVMDNILLTPSLEQLNEVVVRNKQPLIVQKPDRLIYDVQQSIAAKGGDAVDAIKSAPGVSFRNNVIEIIGKGNPRVMINGVLSQLSGAQLTDFLNSISSDDIKSIEIITNPPAKYSAAGSGGLINIIFKSGLRDFWKNSISYSHTQGKYAYYRLRNSFLYNKNKLNLSVGISGTDGNLEALSTSETFYTSGLWISNEEVKKPMDAISGHILLDYAISNKASIGLQYLGSYAEPHAISRIRTDRFDSMGNLESYLLNNGEDNRNVANHSYHLYSTTALDTMGRKLSFDVNYFDFDSESVRNFATEIFSNEDEQMGFDQIAQNVGNQYINSFSGKVDIDYPLGDINLSLGSQLIFTKTKNEGLFFDNATGTPILNPEFSNLFDYKENVQAFYINTSKKLNDKWQLQMGLRLENTQTEGDSKSLNQIDKNTYSQIFPTFYLSHEKNENNTYVLSYGRRVQRPSFRDLNPYRYYFNSFTYSVGNPFLQPSYSHDVELGHVYKGILSTKVFGRLVTNGFGYLFSPNDETNEQITIRENYYKEYSFGLSESYTFNKLSWWESQYSMSIVQYISIFDDTVEATPNNGLDLWLETNNIFSIGETSKLQFVFYYSVPYKRGLFSYGEQIGLNLGYTKQFLDNDLQLSFYINDVLNQAFLNNKISTVNGVKTNYSENYTNRFFRFSISYNFGNKKIKEEKRNSGNEEIKRRTGVK